jgi:hypothetical protein
MSTTVVICVVLLPLTPQQFFGGPHRPTARLDEPADDPVRPEAA